MRPLLFDDAVEPRDFLAQFVGLAQRVLVVVGDRGHEGADLDSVEAAECGTESRLPEVERAYIHARFFSRWLIGLVEPAL